MSVTFSDLSVSPKDTPATSYEDLKESKVQLPTPFYPPGLRDVDRLPRPTHADLPSVPAVPDATTILEQDKQTPDNWVPRDERMVRLTGKHPFNSEAKLEDLYDCGFITSSDLF